MPRLCSNLWAKTLARNACFRKMLHNMGLFVTLEAGKKAMEGMTRLNYGDYSAVLLSPLDKLDIEPDVVVIESKPEHLMWLALDIGFVSSFCKCQCSERDDIQ